MDTVHISNTELISFVLTTRKIIGFDTAVVGVVPSQDQEKITLSRRSSETYSTGYITPSRSYLKVNILLMHVMSFIN